MLASKSAIFVIFISLSAERIASAQVRGFKQTRCVIRLHKHDRLGVIIATTTTHAQGIILLGLFTMAT